ncbi:MAG: response regulator [Cyanophyceae cyanobacterium]
MQRRLDKISVLIVDSNPFERELLTIICEEEGGQAIAVASAREGFAVLETSQLNCVISELVLPKEDGYSLIRRVRSHPVEQIAKLPAIALTTAARQRDRQMALISGFNEYIVKPTSIEYLIGAILLVLRAS